MRSLRAPVAFVPLLLACSTATTNARPSPRGIGDVISGSELQHPIARNAYDLIRLLRPRFFELRGPAALASRAIYVDGLRADHIHDLRLVPADVIVEIRLLNAADATFRYGLDHTQGAIVVTTRVPPRGGRMGAAGAGLGVNSRDECLALRQRAFSRRGSCKGDKS